MTKPPAKESRLNSAADAIVKKYGLTDPALQRLALIVRGADTADKDLTPESRGLEPAAPRSGRGYAERTARPHGGPGPGGRA